MITLKRGQIIINKNKVDNQCRVIRNCLKRLDDEMSKKESFERGKRIAQIANDINFALDVIEHFELKKPIDKIGKYKK